MVLLRVGKNTRPKSMWFYWDIMHVVHWIDSGHTSIHTLSLWCLHTCNELKDKNERSDEREKYWLFVVVFFRFCFMLISHLLRSFRYYLDCMLHFRFLRPYSLHLRLSLLFCLWVLLMRIFFFFFSIERTNAQRILFMFNWKLPKKFEMNWQNFQIQIIIINNNNANCNGRSDNNKKWFSRIGLNQPGNGIS